MTRTFTTLLVHSTWVLDKVWNKVRKLTGQQRWDYRTRRDGNATMFILNVCQLLSR